VSSSLALIRSWTSAADLLLGPRVSYVYTLPLPAASVTCFTHLSI